MPPQVFENNPPLPLTQLIGAEESVVAEARLLTLKGTGSVGKTHLAIAEGSGLLKNFSDGVFFIHLETLNDPALFIAQID